MPTDITKEEIDLGKTLAKWEFPEFIKYQYSKTWYITTGVIVVALLIYSIVDANILFTFIIILITITLIIIKKREPKKLKFLITEEGILLEHKLYLWNEIKNFWVLYEPPKIKTLYFEFNSLHLPRLPIPLEDENPLHVREALLDFVEENIEKEGEPISDSLSRNLKL